ncbi:NADH-ubiquinone oxidoreductase-F iron-sulfur binding region domain-containing protein [Streptomyces scabiei]|uniref:NADH-ubiquinone oxidoreductase-F iron-sulfur binding region domain-containing protein n=2 Tax=Streptomyces scabiei TaxID=1930 RepID=UPI001B315534|nr:MULTISPECIES: NADH-ubiquinone oxidoreductase-F iron-sulfur binding region domain-containing protein [Streptomyces]MBP5913079.1 NADH-quinone oxidoreductase subunit E [Streptomyces sp. LBUM 1486]MDX3030237.1 NADH-ubiquinone oxidoreductase-F iron-sulfur binding region domain-containing protein [Streptomyces scabiei]MDX3208796.1 NADH-ubiquinone oxidoreductase-F iron-sulfur binding region domain-containing protein [Streptomyces scabiei]QTU57502.1 NADH-quinone oxidoreductase subunit E [Streptomyce
MDLHFGDSKPTDEERAAVDALLGPPESSWEGAARDEMTAGDLRWARGGREARDRRDLLLPGLHALNDRIGWISGGALDYLCRRLTVPPAEAYGVATFYAMFSVKPRPATVLHVCTDLACAAAGAAGLCAGVEARLGPGSGVSVERSPCLGLCERAPAALAIKAGDPVRTAVAAPATVEAAVLAASAPDSADEEPPASMAVPQAGDPSLTLLSRVGVVDPSSLDDYRAHGGYAALRRAFALGPAGVIREVTDSGLVGRGGAAFPTGRKWQATASQPDQPHYLVCNADESEPGTFKDRVLLEGDPFSLVEAMTIAGYATGAHRGYLYLRGEYPRALRRLENAIAQARARGLLGDDVLGQGYAFDIEIRRGAGAYICGEETALFNSIEGYRGEPRSKPPFPVEKGLFGKPTVENNVETLVNVLPILALGAPAYASIGTARSTGPKLFCVSGSVDRPGIYELPFGAALGDLLTLAGVRDRLRAVLLGGAAGGFVRPDELDIPLTFEGTREAGTTLGSGVVMAFDDTVPLPRLLLRIAEFFRDESCGQCVPCRVGTVRQEEALHRIAERTGAAAAGDIALLREVGRAMRDASICGLGQTAWNAVESAIDRLGAYE